MLFEDFKQSEQQSKRDLVKIRARDKELYGMARICSGARIKQIEALEKAYQLVVNKSTPPVQEFRGHIANEDCAFKRLRKEVESYEEDAGKFRCGLEKQREAAIAAEKNGLVSTRSLQRYHDAVKQRVDELRAVGMPTAELSLKLQEDEAVHDMEQKELQQSLGEIKTWQEKLIAEEGALRQMKEKLEQQKAAHEKFRFQLSTFLGGLQEESYKDLKSGLATRLRNIKNYKQQDRNYRGIRTGKTGVAPTLQSVGFGVSPRNGSLKGGKNGAKFHQENREVILEINRYLHANFPDAKWSNLQINLDSQLNLVSIRTVILICPCHRRVLTYILCPSTAMGQTSAIRSLPAHAKKVSTAVASYLYSIGGAKTARCSICTNEFITSRVRTHTRHGTSKGAELLSSPLSTRIARMQQMKSSHFSKTTTASRCLRRS